MARRKQAAPQRKHAAEGLSDPPEPVPEPQEDEEQQQDHHHQQDQEAWAHGRVLREVEVGAAAQPPPAFAELLVASGSADAADGGSAPAARVVRSLRASVESRELKLAGVASRHTSIVLVLLWSAEGDPEHQVCFHGAPQSAVDGLLDLLQEGHVAVSCAPLERPAGSGAGAGANGPAQQPQPVQFCTAQPPKGAGQLSCDVLDAPSARDLARASARLSVAAGAVAAAAAGVAPHATAALPPAQHVSLLAAAEAAELLQQPLGPAAAAAAAAATGCARGSSSGGGGAALWRIRFGLTAQGLRACATAAEPTDPGLGGPASRLAAVWDWLVPHWLHAGHGVSGNWQPPAPSFDAAELYAQAKPSGREPMLQRQPPELVAQLRPYQRRGVAWMLARERAAASEEQQQQQQAGRGGPALEQLQAAVPPGTVLVPELHQLWSCGWLLWPPSCSPSPQMAAGAAAAPARPEGPQALRPVASSSALPGAAAAAAADAAADADAGAGAGPAPPGGPAGGEDGGAEEASSSHAGGSRPPLLFFCPYTRAVSARPFPASSWVSGGILCDEPGLGKTVEVLALISTNTFRGAREGEPQRRQQPPPQQQQQGAAAAPRGAGKPPLPPRGPWRSGAGGGGGRCAGCGEQLDRPEYAEGGPITHQQRGRQQRRRPSGGSASGSDAEEEPCAAAAAAAAAADSSSDDGGSRTSARRVGAKAPRARAAGGLPPRKRRRPGASDRAEPPCDGEGGSGGSDSDSGGSRPPLRWGTKGKRTTAPGATHSRAGAASRGDAAQAPGEASGGPDWGTRRRRGAGRAASSSRADSAQAGTEASSRRSARVASRLSTQGQRRRQVELEHEQESSSEEDEEQDEEEEDKDSGGEQQQQQQGRRRPRRRQQRRRAQEDEDDDWAETPARGGGRARAKRARPASPAARGDAAGAGGVLCSLCLRQLALQEVDKDCGTTLIVVPSNILVQWVDELSKHITPGTLSLKVYAGQCQAAAAPVPAPAPAGPDGGTGSARASAAAAAGASAAAGAQTVVTAAELASADVVLSTYDVLRRELVLQPGASSGDGSERSMRRKKRYAVVPTPLSRLRFWRLILDEAQQVQGSTTKAAEMARLLRAKHRWAVTGTPISRGLDDLAGLMRCLQVQPWDGDGWWWRHVIAPAEQGCPRARERLLRLMAPSQGGLMWRCAKADVLGEMGLPPQCSHTTVLRLSAIERHWYNRAHQDCAAKGRKVLQDSLQERLLAQRRAEPGGAANPAAAKEAARAAAATAASAAIAAAGEASALDSTSAAILGPLMDDALWPHEHKRLLLPLLRLRQACCHPQVGASGLRAVLVPGGASAGASKPMTMDEILQVLTAKARTEAEEAQRQLVGALNGLAALARLAGDAAGAVAAYREALATSEAHKHEVRTDPLQLLHTLHNLHDLLEDLKRRHSTQQQQQQPYGPGVPRTLRDGQLTAEAEAIRRAHLAAREAALAAARHAYLTALKDALPVHRPPAPTAGAQQAGAGSSRAAAAAAVAAAAGSRGGRGSGRSRGRPSTASFGRALVDADGDAIVGRGGDGGGGGGEQPEGDEEEGDAGAEEAAAAASGWFVAAIDALQDAEVGEEVAEAIRAQLLDRDAYRQNALRNASSLATRFRSLGALKLLLAQELGAMAKHQAATLDELEQLQEACCAPGGPDPELVEASGQCGRCRTSMGVTGIVCRHCRLDEAMVKWECRIFSIITRALAVGMEVNADEAALQRQTVLNRRIGRGGLDELGNDDDSAAGAGGAGGRRKEAVVSNTVVIRDPSQAEVVLKLLHQHMARTGLSRRLPHVAEAATRHLEQLAGSRKLFTVVSALAGAQRQLLYAHDEVLMALLRIRTRLEGEQVTAHEALFKLTEAEQVIKNAELSLERTVATAEVKRALGTLRYLNTISRTRRRAAAAEAGAESGPAAAAAAALAGAGGPRQPEAADPAAAAAAAAASDAGAVQPPRQQQQRQQQQLAASDGSGGGGGLDLADACPVCHDDITTAAAVLPCGHVLCCSCADSLAARIPASTLPAQRRINCPNCRARVHVHDVSYVDGGRSTTLSYVRTDSDVAADGAAHGGSGSGPGGGGGGGGGAGSPEAAAAVSAGAGAAVAAAYPWAGEQQLVVSGSYGTKVEAVVRRLLFLLREDASARVLVFSTWADVLSIVSHALAANRVGHAYGRGRRGFLAALERFKQGGGAAGGAGGGSAAVAGGRGAAEQPGAAGEREGAADEGAQDGPAPGEPAGGDEGQQGQQEGRDGRQDEEGRQLAPAPCAGDVSGGGVRVLLLLTSQGSLGLNLTEAQHVVLVEPLLDPAVELQSVGRVSRFGQSRVTHVHRFVVEHTVEENVARVFAQRAAAMDMSTAVPAKGPGGATDGAAFTVRDVASLLSARWRTQEEGGGGGPLSGGGAVLALAAGGGPAPPAAAG